MSWDFATNNSLANLHHGIMVDNALSQAERQYASQHVQMDLGNPSLQTPLSGVLPKLGGGFLGYQVGKFMDMSMPGKVARITCRSKVTPALACMDITGSMRVP